MDNEAFKPEKSEEEYHFSETENVATYTELPSKKNILERISRKNIIIALVVILVVVSAYKIMDVLFTSSNKTAPKPPRPLTTQQQPVVENIAAQQKVPAVQPIQPATAKLDEKLNEMAVNNQASLDKLGAQITELQNTLSSLDTRLTNLGNTVQDLVTRQQQEDAKKIAKQNAQAKKHHAAIKPIYFVRALVPGRAWLSTQSGGTVTVSLGHNLPGYGIVTVIDPNQGTVTTDSGAVIGFSPGDS